MSLVTSRSLVHDGDAELAAQIRNVLARPAPRGWAIDAAVDTRTGEKRRIVAAQAAMLAIHRAMTAPRRRRGSCATWLLAPTGRRDDDAASSAAMNRAERQTGREDGASRRTGPRVGQAAAHFVWLRSARPRRVLYVDRSPGASRLVPRVDRRATAGDARVVIADRDEVVVCGPQPLDVPIVRFVLG
jgi:hypothetical protein